MLEMVGNRRADRRFGGQGADATPVAQGGGYGGSRELANDRRGRLLMARRGAPGRNRVPNRRVVAPAAAAAPTPRREPAPPARPAAVPLAGRAALQAPVAFAFGVVAMVALPIAYGWAFRPSTRPAGADILIPALELVGIVAAGVALFLGRRARAFGDRTGPAIWAPRLGGAAIVGYSLTVVLLLFRG
jgi:hypothetical protein